MDSHICRPSCFASSLSPKLTQKVSKAQDVSAAAATPCFGQSCDLRVARLPTVAPGPSIDCLRRAALLSPPAGSAQPCLLRAQRARRAPPSELLQRVKQKAAAAAASPESSTRCCRPARTCTYSLVSGSVVFNCTNISPAPFYAPAPIVTTTAINKTLNWRSMP